jgi:hypothetical protein
MSSSEWLPEKAVMAEAQSLASHGGPPAKKSSMSSHSVPQAEQQD